MRTRRSFLTAAASGVLIAAAPSPPSPTPSPTPVSPAAREFALTMRRFDASLTNAQLDEIARSVEEQWRIGAAVNPKGRVLRNGVEPDSVFRAAQ